MKKFAKSAFKEGISLFFIYLVFSKISWQESLFYLRRVEPWHVLLYLAVIFLGTCLSAYKWKILANHKNFRRPYLDFLRLYITGAFINNFVPSTIGGDVYRAFQIGKRDKRYLESTSVVVMDRFTGLLSLMVMAPFFSFLNFATIRGSAILVGINVAILAGLFGFLGFILIRRNERLRKLLGIVPQKIKAFLRELESFGDDRRIFLIAMAYSFAFNLFGVALANYIIFWSLGLPIDASDYLSVIFIISIISAVPAGLGLKEWSYITLFGFFGAAPTAVATVAILNRFLQGLVNVAALPLYLRNRKNISSSKP